MTKNRPAFTVTPRTADEEAANAAELGEKLMRYLWKHLHMHEATVKALYWSRICAAGFLKTFWDPSVGQSAQVIVNVHGRLIAHPQTGGPIYHGTPVASVASTIDGTSVKSVAQGDIHVEVRSPFQMGIDPLAASFPEVEWLTEEPSSPPITSGSATGWTFRRTRRRTPP